jgi:hypothetical protein
MFSPIYQQEISILSLILGNDDDLQVDKLMLHLMNDIIPPAGSSHVEYDFVDFLAQANQEQLCLFHDFKTFCYESYLMDFLSFFQAGSCLHLSLRKQLEHAKLLSVI